MHLAGLIVGIFLVLIIVSIFAISVLQSINDRKNAQAMVYACKYVLDGNFDPERVRPVNSIIYSELNTYFKKTFSSDQSKLLNNLSECKVLPPKDFMTPQVIKVISRKNSRFNKYDLIQTVTLTCYSANKYVLNDSMEERLTELSELCGIHRIDIQKFLKQVKEYKGD